jgi:hypothetical protein
MTFSQIKSGMFLFRETVEGQFWTKIVTKTKNSVTYDSYIRWLYRQGVEHRIRKNVAMRKWNAPSEHFKSYVLIDEVNEQNFRELVVAVFTKPIEERRYDI